MKVVLLTNFLPPYRIEFLHQLEREIGDLTILVSAHMEDNRDWPFDPGELHVIRQRSTSIPDRWNARGEGFRERRQVHLPLDTVPALRRLAPDVVLSGELGARTLLASSFAKRTGTPLICWATLSEITELELGSARRTLRRFLARRIDHWVVNGASGQREVRRYGASDRAISVIPQSTLRLDDIEPPTSRRRDGALRLLYVGQLTERKGLIPFLEALRDGPRGNWQSIEVTLIGNGPLIEQLRGFDGDHLRVRVRGPLPHDETLAEYAGHDAMILPTLADEWAVVVNEALASGLAVLGSSHSQAVVEMVRDGQEGLVFSPNPRGRADLVERLVRLTREDLVRMQRAAAVRARDFSIERVAPQMAETIRAVAGR